MGFEFRCIIGSMAAVILFGTGLLIYGIIDSNTSVVSQKRTIDAGDGYIMKFD